MNNFNFEVLTFSDLGDLWLLTDVGVETTEDVLFVELDLPKMWAAPVESLLDVLFNLFLVLSIFFPTMCERRLKELYLY